MILSEEDSFYTGLQRSYVRNLCKQGWCLRAWNRPSYFPASSPTWGLFLRSRLAESVSVVGRMLLLKIEVPLQLVGGEGWPVVRIVNCNVGYLISGRFIVWLCSDCYCFLLFILWLQYTIDAHLIGGLRKSSLSVCKMLGYCGVECFGKVQWRRDENDIPSYDFKMRQPPMWSAVLDIL